MALVPEPLLIREPAVFRSSSLQNVASRVPGGLLLPSGGQVRPAGALPEVSSDALFMPDSRLEQSQTYL
jgi:hypothetical protein